MPIRSLSLLASLLLIAAPCFAGSKPAAQVKAAKGPVQLTLSLNKTAVKAGKSAWYKLTLKNIGGKKMRVEGKVFRDPWAMHANCVSKHDIYLEVLSPKGALLAPQRGAGRVRFDYETANGKLSPKDQGERVSFEAALEKKGLSEQERHIAMIRWDRDFDSRKQAEELQDPAKQQWLAPGASTTTIAWAYHDPDEYADPADEEAQVGDYTQLWTYLLLRPGRYRIRAVYDQEKLIAARQKPGGRREPWQVKFKTPYIDFEVIP